MEKQLVLKAESVSKTFPGVKALSDISFKLYAGEAFALLGENGAGKSTFIKVLSGIYQPDEGTLWMDGRQIQFPAPRDAFDAGISVVHQELNYIPMLTVAENIMMSRHPVKKTGIVDWARMNADSKDVLARIGIDIDPRRIINSCTVAEKQQIEIAKALYWNAKIIILDEPTSALNTTETEKLMSYLDVVKRQNVSIVYISHKIDEIFRIADRVAILRDGAHVATFETKETTADKLIQLMVGREIGDMYPKKSIAAGEAVMKVSGAGNGVLHGVSLLAKKGEILGVYGLLGSGHIELGRMLFGDMPMNSGTVEVGGRAVRIKSPADALKCGIAYVPSERKTEGLVLIQSVLENIISVHYEKEKKRLVNRQYEYRAAGKWIERLRIKTPSQKTAVGSLSGGNQQKVVLAKWLEISPLVLIMIDPTRGIDVGSKAEIYQLLDEFCEAGISIIMITSEMPELLAMSDRILVMYEGRINGEFTRSEASQIKVVSAAIGGRPE